MNVWPKKQEQVQAARAREQELKVQGVGDASQGFLEAMQKQYEKAVDGSGVTADEYKALFAQLGKVMANAKEDVPKGPPPAAAGGAGGSNGGGVKAEEVPVPDEGPDLTDTEKEWLKSGGVPEGATEDQRKRWMEICTSLAEHAAKRQKLS